MKKILFLYGNNENEIKEIIDKYKFSEYLISIDTINNLLNTPQLTIDNNQKYTYKKCNKFIRDIIEEKMTTDSFIIIDDKNPNNFSSYTNLIKKYNYKSYVLILSENINKNEYKDIFENSEKQKQKTIILNKENFYEEISFPKINLNKYKAINHYGDIHGCRTVLNNININSDEFYIFLGDYFDRGIENVETLKYFQSIMDRENVVLLSGNHENHLKNHVYHNTVYSRDFNITLKEFNKAKINKNELKTFYKHLQPAFLYEFNEKTILCTHGGIPIFPKDLNKIDNNQFIRGVGGYDVNIDKIFNENNIDENIIQIHGHRNQFSLPILATKTSFNLNDNIEGGGYLRHLKLTKEGFEEFYYKNEVFDPKYKQENENQTIFTELKNDKFIKTKEFDNNIVSFNFTRKAFYDSNWNSRTILARGLFCDAKTKKVIARGYEKFFSINENEFSSLDVIKNLKYPITGYVKENGYLGLIGTHNNDFLFCSKSTIDSDYSNTLKTIFEKTVKNKNELLNELKNNNYCMIFEVIDNINDPHIINYNREQKIILLDVIKKDFKFEKISYEELLKFETKYNLKVKEKAFVFNTYEDFIKEYQKMIKYDYQYNNNKIEGFVFEDSSENTYHFKVKCGYYKFWKIVRNSLERYNASQNINIDKMIHQLSYNEMPEKSEDLRFIYNKIKSCKFITLYKLQELIN